MKRIFTLTILTLFLNTAFGTAWDEPWQKEIIQKSEYLIFGKVVGSTDSLIRVEVLKTFGNNLKGTITIDGFFMLDLCSVSGGGPHFSVDLEETGYFFLKRGTNGNYEIPTPSSGFDRIVEGKVYATYRHTYHQAGIVPEIYEMTYQAIWNHYHSGKYDTSKILSFINEYLEKEPAGFNEDEIDIFFKQHAALETAYLLDFQLDFEQVKKFVESDNFHSKVSGLRVLKNIKSDDVAYYLMQFVEQEREDQFLTVIGLWSLWDIADKKDKKKLWKLRKEFSDEETGFGGNIMDPRICTSFPSPRLAITQLRNKDKSG